MIRENTGTIREPSTRSRRAPVGGHRRPASGRRHAQAPRQAQEACRRKSWRWCDDSQSHPQPAPESQQSLCRARSARTMEALGSRPTITAPEVAQLVAHYLESSFPATGRLFAKEASSLLARAPPLPPSSSLKPLAAVVEEYAALSAAHAQARNNSARFAILARAQRSRSSPCPPAPPVPLRSTPFSSVPLPSRVSV